MDEMNEKREQVYRSRADIVSSAVASSAGAALLGSIGGPSGAVAGAIIGAAAGLILRICTNNYHSKTKKGPAIPNQS